MIEIPLARYLTKIDSKLVSTKHCFYMITTCNFFSCCFWARNGKGGNPESSIVDIDIKIYSSILSSDLFNCHARRISFFNYTHPGFLTALNTILERSTGSLNFILKQMGMATQTITISIKITLERSSNDLLTC